MLVIPYGIFSQAEIGSRPRDRAEASRSFRAPPGAPEEKSGCPHSILSGPFPGPDRDYDPPPPVGARCKYGREPHLAPSHGAPSFTPPLGGVTCTRAALPGSCQGSRCRPDGGESPTLCTSSRGTAGGVSPPARRLLGGSQQDSILGTPEGWVWRHPHRGSSAVRHGASSAGGLPRTGPHQTVTGCW